MAKRQRGRHKSGNVSNQLEKENDTYNPAFVAKILEGIKAKEDGQKGLRVDVENMWEEKPKAKPDELPDQLLKSIGIGLNQIEEEKAISFE